MLRRIQRQYDVPYSVIIRMLLREEYARLFGGDAV